jgi:hypothetical protein
MGRQRRRLPSGIKRAGAAERSVRRPTVQRPPRNDSALPEHRDALLGHIRDAQILAVTGEIDGTETSIDIALGPGLPAVRGFKRSPGPLRLGKERDNRPVDGIGEMNGRHRGQTVVDSDGIA